MRTGKQLLLDSREFAVENRAMSWWVLWSTLAVLVGLEFVIVLAEPLVVKCIASVFAGLVFVRIFILYHDFEHGTILKGSRVTWFIMSLYGLLTLNPPSIWRRSHDHHHKHNAKMYGASIGSFPVMTVDEWQNASRGQRMLYSITRHPLTFVFAYATVFLYGMCIKSLITNPKQHADSLLSIILHIALVTTLGFVGGFELIMLTYLGPGAIAAMIGAYMFYAQHNFPEAKFSTTTENWNFVSAALDSSSYMKTSSIMAWFTGNIGYHHVHHLNHHIPFYRLPEAMKAMPELQSPGTTSLKPGDIYTCLKLKLWDSKRDCLVPYPRDRQPVELQAELPAAVPGEELS